MKKQEFKNKKQSTYSGPFFIIFIITGLAAGIFITNESNQLDKTMAMSGIFFCLLLVIEFLIWFIFQIYNFHNKKLMQPSTGAKLFTAFFLLMMSIGGGIIGVITISILLLGILLQFFIWIKALVIKIKKS